MNREKAYKQLRDIRKEMNALNATAPDFSEKRNMYLERKNKVLKNFIRTCSKFKKGDVVCFSGRKKRVRYIVTGVYATMLPGEWDFSTFELVLGCSLKTFKGEVPHYLKDWAFSQDGLELYVK